MKTCPKCGSERQYKSSTDMYECDSCLREYYQENLELQRMHRERDNEEF